jgi:hypothetical protein
MISELETIALTRDLPDYKLKRGDIGTVVHEYKDSMMFEVEFVTAGGETVGVATLRSSDIRPIEREEILHVRKMSPEAA